MELTKNTSVDPAKMIGKNYIEAINAKFPNTILDEVVNTQSGYAYCKNEYVT